MIKSCIIGISGFGEVHYNDLLREHALGRSEVIAATVINQDEEQEKCSKLRQIGCKLYTDYREMLAEKGKDCDICFIPTGIHLHCQMTIDALNAGCHVFVEKPLAATIQEAEEMKKISRRNNRFVAVGYHHIYADETLRLKQEILDGKIGKILSVNGMCHSPRSEDYYTRNNWAGCLKIGSSWVLDSPFTNANAHTLNMMLFLAGSEIEKSAVPVSIQAELYRANKIESTDTAFFRIIDEKSIRFNFSVTHACVRNIEQTMELKGEKGTIHMEIGPNINITYFIDGKTPEYNNATPDYRSRIFDSLIEQVSKRSGFICDIDIAKTHTRCINGAFQSSPIRDIPRQFIKEIKHQESTLQTINNIEDLVHLAFKEEKLLSELNKAPEWANSSNVFQLKDYNNFQGCCKK